MNNTKRAIQSSENWHLKNKIYMHVHKKHRVALKRLPMAPSLFGIQLYHNDLHAFQNLRHDVDNLDYPK